MLHRKTAIKHMKTSLSVHLKVSKLNILSLHLKSIKLITQKLGDVNKAVFISFTLSITYFFKRLHRTVDSCVKCDIYSKINDELTAS